MCSKKIYPIPCTCCKPATLLKNYNAKKYHLKKMAKKRTTTAASESDDDAPPAAAPAVSKASVNIFVNNLLLFCYCYLFIIFQINAFMKDMEEDGEVAYLFKKYVDDRGNLKALVNDKLSRKTREERLSIKRKILDELAKDSQDKILSDDAFKLSTADFVVSDLQYCERMRFPQSNPEFMTVEDLDFA
jgi:hypothetical protein